MDSFFNDFTHNMITPMKIQKNKTPNKNKAEVKVVQVKDLPKIELENTQKDDKDNVYHVPPSHFGKDANKHNNTLLEEIEEELEEFSHSHYIISKALKFITYTILCILIFIILRKLIHMSLISNKHDNEFSINTQEDEMKMLNNDKKNKIY